MTVEILGDADEAKQVREQETILLNQSEIDSDNDNENLEVEVKIIDVLIKWIN